MRDDIKRELLTKNNLLFVFAQLKTKKKNPIKSMQINDDGLTMEIVCFFRILTFSKPLC